jgi:hypothetical protein
MKTYSFRDLMQLTGASRSHLTHWLKQGVVSADVAEGSGPGHHRQFGFFNLIEAHVAERLSGINLPAGLMGFTLTYLRGLEELHQFDDVAIEQGFQASLRPFARTVGKKIRAKRVRIAEVPKEMAAQHVRDVQLWRQVRCPGQKRDEFSYFGLTYAYEPDLGGALPQMMAIPADAVVLPHVWRAFSALVIVNLSGIADLEAKTGDSLCSGDAQQ